MASIIKNQIIKHLSAFARNLTPDQISVEVLRGKGELRNIELNEDVLTERLELPPWLKICRAVCNKITVKVPWTKLKSLPVELYVDEINVTIRLLPSAPMDFKKTVTNNTSKAYDLAERVVEGLSLYVLNVEVHFESDRFDGTLNFSRLAVESKTPIWKDEKNINLTRVHDKIVRQILFFKQVSWQCVRVVASAHNDPNSRQKNNVNAPLRLITGEGKCRIAIKKSDINCAVIDGRIEVILEEILWVATLVQVRSAIDFYKHITDLANAAKKQKETNPFLIDHPPSKSTPINRGLINISDTEASAAFKQFNIHQSSHHLYIGKIDLHLYDDTPDTCKFFFNIFKYFLALPIDWSINNGAIQTTLYRLRVDFYPSHKVFDNFGRFSDRSGWIRYQTPNGCTELAAKQLDRHFKNITLNMQGNCRDRFLRLWSQLNSQNVVIRIEDIVMQCVSEQTTKKEALMDMFIQDKRTKNSMPSNMSFFHMEASTYYFPASNSYPVPPDSTHLVLGPCEFLMDLRSIRWIVYVYENILNAFEAPQNSQQEFGISLPEFRAELFMPKIVFLSPEIEANQDPRLPTRFIVNFSTVHLSNFVLNDDHAMLKLPTMYQGINKESLDYVLKMESMLVNLELYEYLLFKTANAKNIQNSNKILLNSNQFYLSIPSIWICSDFGKKTGFEAIMVDDFTLSLSLIQSPQKLLLLVEPSQEIRIVLDHFQFLQILQLQLKLIELIDQIESDRDFFTKSLANLPEHVPLGLFCLAENIKLNLILPAESVPSPYDLKWPEKAIPVSNTTSSMGSEPLSNQTNVALEDNVMLSQNLPSHSDSMTNLVTNLKPLMTSASNSQLDISNIPFSATTAAQGSSVVLTPKNHIQNNIVEIHPSRRQISNFPDFPNITDLEMSNMDETMSITTSTSDCQQLLFESTNLNVEEDLFINSEDIVVAEEASMVDEQSQMEKMKRKFFEKEVNSLDLTLENIIFVLILSKQFNGDEFPSKHPSLAGRGYADRIRINERLGEVCGNIYNNRLKETSSNNEIDNTKQRQQLQIDIQSKNKKTIIKLLVNGDENEEICLSDEVISQLGPFIEDNLADSIPDPNPPLIDIALQNLNLRIKNPKKPNPIRIRVGKLNVIDGADS